ELCGFFDYRRRRDEQGVMASARRIISRRGGRDDCDLLPGGIVVHVRLGFDVVASQGARAGNVDVWRLATDMMDHGITQTEPHGSESGQQFHPGTEEPNAPAEETLSSESRRDADDAVSRRSDDTALDEPAPAPAVSRDQSWVRAEPLD